MVCPLLLHEKLRLILLVSCKEKEKTTACIRPPMRLPTPTPSPRNVVHGFDDWKGGDMVISGSVIVDGLDGDEDFQPAP